MQLRADVAVAKKKLAAVAKTPAVRDRNTPTIWKGVPVYDLSQVDEKPKAVAQVPPVYPLGLRMDDGTGEVIMRFIIDAKGDVQDASVVKSSDPDFSAAALAAVKQWKYSPARKSGQPVNIAVQMPSGNTVDFDLKTSRSADGWRESASTGSLCSAPRCENRISSSIYRRLAAV